VNAHTPQAIDDFLAIHQLPVAADQEDQQIHRDPLDPHRPAVF
jgi:hypothetical protein